MRLEKCIIESGAKKVYHCTVVNTEQLGLYVERGICDITKIPFNTVRTYPVTPRYLTLGIKHALTEYIKEIGISSHTGHRNHSYDFRTQTNKTVSVKTVMNSNNKICPQKVGQCTVKRFYEHFCKTAREPQATKDSVKVFVSSHLDSLLTQYLDHTFCCDHTILLHFGKGECHCIDKFGRLSFARGLKFTLKNGIDEWNESNTVYIETNDYRKTLGEFQIHNNRDSVKFRFNTETIVKLITDNYIRGTKYTTSYLPHGYNISVRGRGAHAKESAKVQREVRSETEKTRTETKKTRTETEKTKTETEKTMTEKTKTETEKTKTEKTMTEKTMTEKTRTEKRSTKK